MTIILVIFLILINKTLLFYEYFNMVTKYIFCIQILTLILICYFINKNFNKELYKYNIEFNNLESYQSLNLPCIKCSPTLWEIEQISGISLKQAKLIKKILDSQNRMNKYQFMNELIKIKGIGKKKSLKIAKLFYF